LPFKPGQDVIPEQSAKSCDRRCFVHRRSPDDWACNALGYVAEPIHGEVASNRDCA
jgi:hypothetical protein